MSRGGSGVCRGGEKVWLGENDGRGASPVPVGTSGACRWGVPPRDGNEAGLGRVWQKPPTTTPMPAPVRFQVTRGFFHTINHPNIFIIIKHSRIVQLLQYFSCFWNQGRLISSSSASVLPPTNRWCIGSPVGGAGLGKSGA
jgi:hypothetical protein